MKAEGGRRKAEGGRRKADCLPALLPSCLGVSYFDVFSRRTLFSITGEMS